MQKDFLGRLFQKLGNPFKFLRAEPGLQPGSKKLRLYLVPRFLPNFVDFLPPNYTLLARISKRLAD